MWSSGHGSGSKSGGRSDPERERRFSEKMACPNHHPIAIDDLEPRSFSFNSPYGACPECDGLGVRKERIAYEFFGPASLLTEAAQTTPQPVKPPAADQSPAGDGPHIVLHKSGRRLAWDGTSESILAFLEAQGIEPEFSCRAGVCGTCEQGLVSGEVDYFEEPLDVIPQDRVLLCCTRPKSSLVLDL